MTAGDEYYIERNGWYGTHHWVGVSGDGGRSFTETTYDVTLQDSNAYPYRIVAHPFNATVAVITGYSGMPVTSTHDAGTTWGNASYVAANGQTTPLLSVGPYGNFWWAQPLARDNNADPSGSASVPATIYYYNGTTSLFTSVDNGVSWKETYIGFPTWNVPLFGLATPPRGTAAAGDIWAFAGWQLHRSTNGGANFSQVWQFYSVKNVIAVGPLPSNVSSRRTGRSAAEMSALCAERLPAGQRPRGASEELISSDVSAGRAWPYPLSYKGAPAYVVYAIGVVSYSADSSRVGLYVSADYGQSWHELTTATQGLGDSPNVLEASLSSPGMVFVGTEGRGAFYADASDVILRALEDCEAYT